MEGQCAKRNEALHERGVYGVGLFVTIPSAVGPLPGQKAFRQHLRPSIGQTEGKKGVQGVALQ